MRDERGDGEQGKVGEQQVVSRVKSFKAFPCC